MAYRSDFPIQIILARSDALALTPEQRLPVGTLAAVDAITTKLRQAWLRPQEQARATLSAD